MGSIYKRGTRAHARYYLHYRVGTKQDGSPRYELRAAKSAQTMEDARKQLASIEARVGQGLTPVPEEMAPSPGLKARLQTMERRPDQPQRGRRSLANRSPPPVRYLAHARRTNVLLDVSGQAFRQRGLRASDDAAQHLVRPGGYIAFKCAGRDLRAVDEYLARWAAEFAAQKPSSRRSGIRSRDRD